MRIVKTHTGKIYVDEDSDTTFDAIVRSLSSIVVTTTPDQSDKVPIVQIIDSE